MKEQNYLLRFFFPHTLKSACIAPNKCIALISRIQTNFINMQIEAQYFNWWYILDFLWTNNKFDTNVICFMLIEYNHCVKSVRIRSFSGRHFPAFGLYADQKITPNTDTFHAVNGLQFVRIYKKITKCHKKNSYIFLHNNDCKTPYIDIYIDLLSINFNLLSIL